MRPVDRLIAAAEEDPEDWRRIERDFVDRGQLEPLWDRALTDPRRAIRMTLGLRRYCTLRDREDLYLAQAERIPDEAWAFAEVEDVLRMLVSMGQCAATLGDLEAAMEYYRRVVEHPYRDDPDYRAFALTNIARIHVARDEWDLAVDHYDRAVLEFRQPGGDAEGLAAALSGRGQVASRTGDPRGALRLHHEALEVLEPLDRPEVECVIWRRIGSTHDDLGEPHEAIAAYEAALPLCRQVGDRSGEAATLTGLALVQSHLGRHRAAYELLAQAREVEERLPRFDRRALLNNMATVLVVLGDTARALEYHREVLRLEREADDLLGQAIALNNIGLALMQQERYLAAQEHYLSALPLWQAVRHDLGTGRTLQNLAVAETELGRLPDAMRHLLRAERIQRRLGARSDLGITVNNMGLVLHRTTRPERAAAYYRQAVELHAATDNPDELGTSVQNLAELESELAEHDRPR